MLNKNTISPGASLAAMRKTQTKVCPEKGCGLIFTALTHASSTCKKCRDRLRKQTQRIKAVVAVLPQAAVLILVTPASKKKPHDEVSKKKPRVEAWHQGCRMDLCISFKFFSALLDQGVVRHDSSLCDNIVRGLAMSKASAAAAMVQAG